MVEEKMSVEKMEDEFLKDYTCTLVVEKMSDADVKAFLAVIEKEDGILTKFGRVECVFGGTEAITTECGDIVFGLQLDSDSDVQPALEDFFKSLGIKSEFWVNARAMDFSFNGAYHFENGAISSSRNRACHDNRDAIDAIKVSLAKSGRDVPEIFRHDGVLEFNEGFREEGSVFETLHDSEVTRKMFWPGFETGRKVLEAVSPKSIDDLRAYVAFMTFNRDPEETVLANARLYADRRDGKAETPAGLPESLRKTYGLWLYETQEEDAKKAGLKPAVSSTEPGKPCLVMVSKLHAATMYEFMYLCAKFGVHRNLE